MTWKKRLLSMVATTGTTLMALEMGGAAVAVTLSGTINWTDRSGGIHPVRQSQVKVWDEDFGGDELVTFGSTGVGGQYFFTFDNNDGIGQGNRDIYLQIFSDGPVHYVENTGPFGSTYTFMSTVLNEIPNGANTLNVTIPNITTTERAFSVSDAVYTGGLYATVVRGLPSTLEVNFPESPIFSFFDPNSSFYDPSGKDLNILDVHRWDWDVILHEYGHFLADLDHLDNHPGGSHTFGNSNIPTRGKNAGTRLGWGEGVATYLAIAAQQVTAAAGLLPPVPTTGDTFYEDTSTGASARVDLETSTAMGGFSPMNAGEGDEASVMRILWDIADSNQDNFDSGLKDEISVGHRELYNILNNNIPNLDKLDQVWDYFYGISNDAQRTKFGAIFEEYDVSPEPTDGPIGKAFSLGSPPPNFQWNRNNNNANDQFQVIVFNKDFSIRELDFTVPGDVTQWTPTQAQWNSILNNGTGLRNFIVAGSDTNDFTTGAYWSGTRPFALFAANESDFGDAPESYKTKLDPSDPGNPLKGGPRYDEGFLQGLGTKWDSEIDGQPTSFADG